MKLFKPSYSYGAKQSSFSKYEHHEQMSQSNYALDAKPCYDAQTQDYFLGQPMGGFDANESHHARGQNSINYHAQAQSTLPSLPLHVQQGHQVGKMKRHDSHMGNEWGANSPKYAYPVDDSRLGMHNEKQMMGKMEHGWGNKPNQYSSPTQPHHFGESDYKGYGQDAYNHVDDGVEGRWGNNPNEYSSPTQTHLFGDESGYKGHDQNVYNNYGEGQIEGGYPNKNNAFASPKHLSPIKTNQPNIIKYKEGHGWPNSSSNYSSPTHAQHSNMGMHKDSHMMGKLDHGWANSPNKFPSSTPAHQSAHLMPNNEHMMQKGDQGWSHSPNKISNSPQTHHTNLGGIDRGMDNSPSKLYGPTQAHHSSRRMHRQEHMTTGNENCGWPNSPMKYSGPNNFNNSNEREHAQLGWGQNSSKGLGLNQANHSGYAVHDDEHDQYVDDDVHDIMDEILTKYPAHNVGSGSDRSWTEKPNSYAGQNKFAGYAKQAIGGLAHYGGAIQSMSKSSAKFALTKENNSNAGYSSNFGKEEHSASSNNKKYEAKFTLDRGRYR